MLVDLNAQFENDIEKIYQDFLTNKGFEYIDGGEMVGIRTPFQVTDGVNELVYYIIPAPGIEVLNYIEESNNEVMKPWICFDFGIRDDLDEEQRNQILRWFRNHIKQSSGYQPFEDEDANQLIFTKGRHISNFAEYRYKFFINVDYANGYWCNHTIDCIDL